MPFHQPRVITRKKTYDVTIKCEENTSLDDRTEVINIKSDYWTGKKFTLTQKRYCLLRVRRSGYD